MGLLKFEFELLKFKFKPTPQAWPVLFAHNIIKVVSNLNNFFSQFPFENNWKDPLPIFWPSLINSYHSPKHCGEFACQLALVQQHQVAPSKSLFLLVCSLFKSTVNMSSQDPNQPPAAGAPKPAPKPAPAAAKAPSKSVVKPNQV